MASGIMGVGVTAVRVGFIFFVCTRSPPSDHNPPPLPPPPPSPSSRFLQVAGKVTPGLVCRENNGGPICPAIARKAVFRLLPTSPPPHLIHGHLQWRRWRPHLSRERADFGERTNRRKQAAQGCLAWSLFTSTQGDGPPSERII